MPLIGSRKHAREIHEWWSENRFNNDLPDGWEKLGSGGSRVAYLHKATNVVYKIQGNTWDDDYSGRKEVQNAQRLFKMSNGDGFVTANLRIPRTSGFRFGEYLIVAMEAAFGVCKYEQGPVAVEGRADLFRIGRFEDMHGSNYVVEPSGTIVPIDMASPRKRSLLGADSRVLSGTHLYEQAYNSAYSGEKFDI
jgi:hypothetical protein